MSRRDEILRDIRSALSVPSVHEQEDIGPTWPCEAYRNGDLYASFRHRFESVGGVWHGARDRADASRQISKIARPEIWCSVEGLGLEAVRTLDFDVQTTVTGADAAIAETGSFGLLIRPGQGRLASLVAPLHIVVMERTRFFDRLESFLAMAHKMPGSAALLITGPSRTADIESTLTIGVHGPKEVHAVIIGDAS